MDLSLSQLMIVACVAVIVLGPRQTATLAFSAGRLWGKARAQLTRLRRELEGESAEVRRGFSELGASVSAAVNEAQGTDTPRFCASYTPAALSSAALQQEIVALKSELERLKTGGRNRPVKKSRRHEYVKRSIR